MLYDAIDIKQKRPWRIILYFLLTLFICLPTARENYLLRESEDTGNTAIYNPSGAQQNKGITVKFQQNSFFGFFLS